MSNEMNNQAAQTMPALVDEALTYFAKAGDDGDRRYVEAIRQHIAALSQTAGVADGGLEAFTDYFVKNYPGPDTIIYDPKWHAPRIFRAAHRAIQAAAPAASGGEDGWSLAMRVREALDRASCPDHFMRIAVETITGDAPQPPAAASVSERARELLAVEYERDGSVAFARMMREGKPGHLHAMAALRAIEQALTQQRGDVFAWADNHGEVIAADALNAYRQAHGEGPASCYHIPLYTTPQPGAEALRAVGWLNFDGSSYLPTEKRDRMIEAGKREGASVGEVTFGKIAEDHRTALYALPPSVAGLVTELRDRINVDPEDPYEHGVSDTLMEIADKLESLLARGGK